VLAFEEEAERRREPAADERDEAPAAWLTDPARHVIRTWTTRLHAVDDTYSTNAPLGDAQYVGAIIASTTLVIRLVQVVPFGYEPPQSGFASG